MAYIRSASCISVQPANAGGAAMRPVHFPAAIAEPDYKEFINPALLRRMSPVVKFGTAAAIACLKQAGIEKPQAIITGTGLGCLRDTQKFMETFLASTAETLPPTAFIQSTHNTVAGQIALQTGCHGYNMTFVQNCLSFEYALMDAQMMLEEGGDLILTGAADEKIPLLTEMAQRLGLAAEHYKQLSEGAAFFLLTNRRENAIARITDVYCHFATGMQPAAIIESFLEKNKVSAAQIDCVLYGANNPAPAEILNGFAGPVVNFIPYCGYYFTNSAFGLYMALQILQGHLPQALTLPQKAQNVLLINYYQNQSLGLVLIEQT